MKRLYLLRHAKAVRDLSIREDALRPLAPRGREDATRLAGYFAEARLRPDRVLCSAAIRTRETWTIVVSAWEEAPETSMLPGLYLASAEAIFGFIRRAGDAPALMIVGHNPGLEDCARALAGPPRDDKMRKRLVGLNEKFPTCALAALDFPIDDWCEIAEGEGSLALLLRPADLGG